MINFVQCKVARKAIARCSLMVQTFSIRVVVQAWIGVLRNPTLYSSKNSPGPSVILWLIDPAFLPLEIVSRQIRAAPLVDTGFSGC
jgi:hypothetical protein